MGELGALFNPGMRHELEERQAKAARREEEGNARDGDLRIDLESGVAVINIPGETTSDDRHAEVGRRLAPTTSEAEQPTPTGRDEPPATAIRRRRPEPAKRRAGAPRRCGPGQARDVAADR